MAAVQDTGAILRALTSMAEELFHRGVSGEGIHMAVKRAAVAGLQDETGEGIDKLVLAALRAAYRHLYGVEFEESNDTPAVVDGRAVFSWTTRPPARV